jgi:hypothetical protein
MRIVSNTKGNMSFTSTSYKVMIASPSDVDQERNQAREVIHEWNAIYAEDRRTVLLPVGWDTHAAPAMGARPQEVINERVLKGCDLLVAVFWTRVGSPTGKAISGTVEEIQEHLDAGKPAMIYFSNQPVRPDSVDDAQYKSLQQFKDWCRENGLVDEYSSLGEFRTKFTRQLAQTILQDAYFHVANTSVADQEEEERAERPSPDARLAELSPEAKALLLEASEDRSGTVMKIAFIGGFYVQTNGKQFVEAGNPRSRAAWEGAIDQLCRGELLQERGYKGEVFVITAEGYRIADAIRFQSGG